MLNERHARGLEDRELSVELAADMGLYSGRLSRGSQDNVIVERDPNGNVLCWPYWEGDIEVNCKYRWVQDGERRFMQKRGATKTVYNANVLLNEETMTRLEVGTDSLIWVEGEPDCHAVLLSGYDTCISVPDGAPPARDKNGKLIHVPDDDRDIDPEDDDKFAFMARLMDQIMRVKYHIIAVDGDEPGGRLAKELVRRIGAAKCFWIEYPKDDVVPDKKKRGKLRPCKDMNEVKKYFGPEKVREIIENAKPWPVKGLFRLSDYPDLDIPMMIELGISKKLDDHMKLYQGQFVVATGIPNVGKSTLINQIVTLAAKRHKWPVAVFSGEKDVKPFLANELMTAFLDKAKDEWSLEEKKRAEAFVQRYFQFIDYDESLDQDIDLDFILDRAAAAVFRDGVKVLLIDPWNELEHNRPMNISLTEYVGKAIKKMKRFAKQFGVCVIVVAHPTKLDLKSVPTLYNISDSAHWYNKADLGIVVHADQERIAEAPNERQVIIAKVRLKRIAGLTGIVDLSFDDKASLFRKPDF
ncbi:DnaB-like helicase C-terminal domain-containing protein [Bradyrhizobium erythrophlei]|uniref:Twinkle protein n=1 Tax=Bradyrhizobium erythrophlei TaxID=1437360 RepID=A0A1M5PPT9_9BRAD|nr:DnaB-like helicase C-terminal domain-containing protein [Bradyrhizobium erythrophlei]SHH03768.1 twinkle protein [Bradyrhizobium erythrophlei]